MIRLEQLTKIFGQGTAEEKTVIRKVDFQACKGDFVTIIGSNGAGKTTLFNLISGALMPTSGRILIDGKAVTRKPEYKRAACIGRIFQDPLAGTASNMTIEDNMMITSQKGFKWPIISLNNKKRAFFREQVRQLNMGLEHRLKDNVSALSGGQRQALTLLMTVLSDPAILLLDEHTAALDPRNAEKVMSLTTRFVREKQLTALMVTHNMTHAIRYGNRLIMMDAGEIIIDVSGPEKQQLTVARLVEMFSRIRQKDFETDAVLLAQP